MSFLAAFDPQAIVDWVLGHLGPIFIAIVFFVLPILRGLKEQAAKKKELEARGETPPAREEPSDGRKAWEALLRGEEPGTPPPPPVVVRAPTLEPPPLVRPVEGSERQATLAGELTGKLSDFAPTPTEEDEETSLDEEGLANELNERLLREEMQRRADFLAREKASAARQSVAPEALVTIEASEAVVKGAFPGSARNLLLPAGVDRRSALRRALVAREVLGPPLALRTHIDALGPTALSG